jgi:RHS repeat-associated protein
MARTAPVPNIPAIPGMNPGLFVLGGGGDGGGSGAGGGKGKGKGQGANGKNGGKDANGGGKGACGQGAGSDGGACPNNHGGSMGAKGGASQGDPIDVVTGRVFTMPVVDLDLPGPMPLILARQYSTTSRERDVGLGYGWTHTLAWEIEVRRTRVIVWTEDGLDVSFGSVERDTGNLGPHGWVLHREGEGFALDIPDGTRRIFEPDLEDPSRSRFRLTAVEDRAKNRIELQYGGTALSRIVDSVGRIVRVSSTREGRITALDIVCVSGRVVCSARYDYDGKGRLVGAFDADGHGTIYVYDDDNRLLSYRLPTGLSFFFVYDSQGRGVESWGEHPGAKDPCLADDLPSILADGKTEARGIHHVKLEYGPDGYSECVDATQTFRYFGNEHGKVDKAVSNGAVFSRTYDTRGNLTSYTDPMGATTCWERDLFGNETRIVDPLGQETVIERLPNGDVTRIVDPGGGETIVSYTKDSLLMRDPIGATFQVRYDERGLPVETTAPNGRKRFYRYDSHGNAIEGSDGRSVLWQATFDELGRCTSMRDEAGGVTRCTYSNKGLVLAIEEPGGLVSRFEYDGMGNVIEAIDPSGRRTSIVRGGTGVLADARLPDGTTVRMRYDRKEQLVRVLNARGEAFTIERSPTGLTVRERTFDGREISYEHNAAGRVVRASFGDGDEVLLVRDELGRIVQRERADGSIETFEYDFRDEITCAKTAAGTVELHRNAVGWVTKERQIIDGEAPFEVEIEHDILGLPVRLRTSLGHTAEWRRDYDARAFGLCLDGAEELAVKLDAAGREIERVLSRGGRMLFGYDASGRLLARRVLPPSAGSPTGRAEPEWVGTRDAAATIEQRFEYNGASELAALWDARFGVVRYDYDLVGQIVAAVPEGARGELFAYDQAKNVHDKSLGAPSREYGPGNLLLRNGPTSYAWDTQGRLTERRTRAEEGEHVISYTWAAANTLTCVVLADGTTVELTYDAFARRLKKTVYQRAANGARTLVRTTRFHWHGDTLLHEVVDAGTTRCERRYHFGTDGEPWAHRESISRDDEPQGIGWIYYLNDLAGFPERLMDGGGRIVGEIQRTVWGVATARDGSSAPTPIRFLGQYADAETGLHYNRYRYYDPEVGRYISPDPIDLEGGLNAFAYAQNSPFHFGDPYGLVYTKITDHSVDPPKVYEGYNIDEARGKHPDAGGQIPQDFHKNSCAETQALQRMKNDIKKEIEAEQAAAKKKGTKKEPFKPKTPEEIDKEANDKLKKKLENPNTTIETFQEKGGPRVDPCAKCGEMIRGLGASHAVVGAGGKKGKWGLYKRPAGY